MKKGHLLLNWKYNISLTVAYKYLVIRITGMVYHFTTRKANLFSMSGLFAHEIYNLLFVIMTQLKICAFKCLNLYGTLYALIFGSGACRFGTNLHYI